MPTFLDLARKVASESGTVQAGRITSVTESADRIAKVVRWTNDAYRQIQNARPTWRWLEDDFAGALVPGKARYSAAELGIERFAEWVCRQDWKEDRFTILDPASAMGDRLRFMDWPSFYAMTMSSTPIVSKPSTFSISPRGQIAVWPAPDAAYVLRGPYRLAPQELAADDDVPEMPSRFHDIIVSAALVLLTTHDEAAPTLTLYQMRAMRGFSELEMDQLPMIQMAGTLA